MKPFRIKNRKKRARVALKRLSELEVRPDDNTVPDYVRMHFGHGWQDLDGDGQNERAEVLISAHRPGKGKVDIQYGTELEHRVVSGRWRCRFSGDWVTDAKELDIDHLVPLAEAWKSGAYTWDDVKREHYANGVGVRTWRRSWLLPVSSGLNRSKGAKAPDEWLPPNERYHLHYAADWIATKKYWHLSVTSSEVKCLRSILEKELA